ncbi:MAG: hypothetical protein ACOYM3_13765 [Terrimicrobiaceae bacterium]
MRILIFLGFLAFSLLANAGQLDLAIVQFPEVKTAEELNAALASVILAELTNSNRTMTPESYLKGGYVVFAQSLPATGSFASSTRISNNRADVEGKVSGNNIAVTITLGEGVDAGLRRFSSRTYQANASLAPGQPRILSLRQISGKSAVVTKGQSSIKETNFTSAIIGQITK